MTCAFTGTIAKKKGDNMKKLLWFLSGVCFAGITFGILIVIVGAVCCAVSIATDVIPTTLQKLCLVAFMALGGVVGAFLYSISETD